MKISELKAGLEQRGLVPRNRFGQNFLIDPALLKSIPKDAGVQTGDRVLEVGPGAGALTEELLAAGALVLGVEIDVGLHAWLQERFHHEISEGSLRLVEGDVLAKTERLHPEVEAWWNSGPPPRVVSNLPYVISGPFLGRLPGRPLLGAHILLQKEMAEKAAGRGGAGSLPVRLGLSFEVSLGRGLPPEVFWPRPKVDSIFLNLHPLEEAPSPAEEKVLRELLRLGFAQKRKCLLPRLSADFPAASEALTNSGVLETARPEEVPASLWLKAAREVIIQDSSSP
ncbi:MAG: hypothetical protein CMJ96_05915 [Planctomycetes bacterium]|jgi:16S rRNA (adenine1518-N6/adenine1519-N6)-dimethyltransferase|nr:hypothetical protein [Planctomycetota bacterium]MDP7245601.1 rRNA adenine dimethyltransferase family protein [Planctomycetota bacterium]MDP7560597.1 rRNA adenine dimethyltransferase family protein [Planctomycetota bacterium]|tara:strand:+ start:30298 stop:31146 length:849 start_codon:yes stop_codon:yes gene_type:complete